MDKVFNILEETPYYTTFEEVEIEDVDESFLTEEEMTECGYDYKSRFSVGEYSDNKVGHVNVKEIKKAATEASLLFKNRGKKGGKLMKTVPYPLDFDDDNAQEEVRTHFREALSKRKLKYIGGRVRADLRVTELFSKVKARKGLLWGMELLLNDSDDGGYDIDVKLRETHIIKKQKKAIKFFALVGITCQEVLDYIENSQTYYLEEAKKEESHDYLNEFWDESLTYVEEEETED